MTCNFPPVNTTDAFREIINSNKQNEFLKSCKVPKILGGTVDLLLGIKYSLIQPVPVQALDNCLTIPVNPLTLEEEEFAIAHNAIEVKEFVEIKHTDY